MGSTVYFTTVTNDETGEPLAVAFGNFGVTSYIAKDAFKAIAGQSGTFSARIVEVESYGEDIEKRSVAKVSGDADVVIGAVKRKLAIERKRVEAGEPETENAEQLTTTDAEQYETV